LLTWMMVHKSLLYLHGWLLSLLVANLGSLVDHSSKSQTGQYLNSFGECLVIDGYHYNYDINHLHAL